MPRHWRCRRADGGTAPSLPPSLPLFLVVTLVGVAVVDVQLDQVPFQEVQDPGASEGRREGGKEGKWNRVA